MVKTELRYKPGLHYLEVGHGRKGKYKVKYVIDSHHRAQLWYVGINIGNGFKKRWIYCNYEGRLVKMALHFSEL